MGLLDFFSKSPDGALKKHAGRVANKRAQAADRWESIRSLGEMSTPEAVEALLVRFTYTVDPSITDQEEKDAVCEAIVSVGEAAVEPLKQSLADKDSIAWPLKCLDRIQPPEEVIGDLLGILESMDTDYERDPQKKIQVLATLEERRDPRIVEVVRRFLEDMNETTRFHAVGALLAQVDEFPDEVRSALLEAYLKEESMRVRARILDAFAERKWTVGDHVDEARERLPRGYALTAKGEVKKSG